MKNELTELVFILDRSGSMHGLEADTVGGFNAMMEKQQREPGRACVSVVLFDDGSEVICDRQDLRGMRPMRQEDYQPGGCTALLDAMGGAIRHISTIHRYARPEDRPGQTLFVIITDGQENASRHYTYARVREMVEHQQEKHGWEFIFLGAGIDAIGEAARFGIHADHAARYVSDHAGTALNYEVLDEAVSCARACRPLDTAVLDRIRDDCEKREKKH